ncbi:hypothetical protein BaRGS_00027341 [Batillaria attramentaria]|uniref:Uncharacterized protein n=1 Tax=Batillaria attramentaria TaxID=370345 RepID=A0ABD0K1U8_9CAEN
MHGSQFQSVLSVTGTGFATKKSGRYTTAVLVHANSDKMAGCNFLVATALGLLLMQLNGANGQTTTEATAGSKTCDSIHGVCLARNSFIFCAGGADESAVCPYKDLQYCCTKLTLT